MFHSMFGQDKNDVTNSDVDIAIIIANDAGLSTSDAADAFIESWSSLGILDACCWFDPEAEFQQYLAAIIKQN